MIYKVVCCIIQNYTWHPLSPVTTHLKIINKVIIVKTGNYLQYFHDVSETTTRAVKTFLKLMLSMLSRRLNFNHILVPSDKKSYILGSPT